MCPRTHSSRWQGRKSTPGRWTPESRYFTCWLWDCRKKQALNHSSAAHVMSDQEAEVLDGLDLGNDALRSGGKETANQVLKPSVIDRGRL